MPKLLVCNIAGLSPRLLSDPTALGRTRARLGGLATVAPVKPAFPAVTCTAQATYSTGRRPSEHGIISNGLYDPERRTVSFWQQAAGLVPVPQIWDAVRQRRVDARTAYLFWWNGMHSTAEVFMNVAPFHFADGRTVAACYSDPPELYDRIHEKLGPFPLHRFWGPLTSIESSAWIAAATQEVIESSPLDLVLTYIPHLDYSQQKFGPTSEAVAADLAELDGVLEGLVGFARDRDFEVLLLSEYGIGEVNGAVALNQEFRRQKWIAIREGEGMEFVDIGRCRAFAMVDHQVAHIYTQSIDNEGVAEFVASLDGVADVLVGDRLYEAGLDHPRAGSIVAVAEKDKWFSYPWWLDPDKAPDFAGTIDIHRKPGFDPLEMFFDPATKKVSQDTALIRGSHGRVPESKDEWAVALASFPLPAQTLAADEIFDLLINQVTG